MNRHESDLLIARCGWLACHGEQEREAEMLLRHALIFLALTGIDTRWLSKQVRDRLMSEGRLRLAGNLIQILYQGDDFTRLHSFCEEAFHLIKLELYASMIGHTHEVLAERCEKRSLALIEFADRLIRETDPDRRALVYKAAYLNEMKALLAQSNSVDAAEVANRTDHFFSQLSRLRIGKLHPDSPKRPVANDVKWTKIDRGLRHGQLLGNYRFGPLRANALEISPKRWRLIAADARLVPADKRSLLDLAKAHNSRFGTNGGFSFTSYDFNQTQQRTGEPIGLLVGEGEVLNPPTIERTALLTDDQGMVDIWRLGCMGLQIRIRQTLTMVRKVDAERIQPGEIVLYTSAYARQTPAAPLSLALLGRRVLDVAHNKSLPVPVNGLVLAIYPGPAGPGQFIEIEPGDLVSYQLPPMRGLGRIETAMAAGPTLVADGHRDGDLEADNFNGALPPIDYGPRTRAAFNLNGRTAWGITRDYNLLALTVDGGNVPVSAGIDLDNLARLMRDLGCLYAVNMAGGAFAQMIVDGETVDRNSGELMLDDPTDDIIRYPIANALLVVERQ